MKNCSKKLARVSKMSQTIERDWRICSWMPMQQSCF